MLTIKKIVGDDGDANDLYNYALLFETQIPKIINRLKNEPESVLAQRYVKLFRVNIGGVLERVQQHKSAP